MAILAAVMTYGAIGVLLHQRMNQYVMDAGIGVTATLLLVYCCVEARKSHGGAGVPRLLSFKPVVWLGTFSYSMYLTHGIVLTKVSTFFASRHIGDSIFLSAIWLAGIGLSIVFAFAFHLMFERPFLTSSQKRNYSVTQPLPMSQKG